MKKGPSQAPFGLLFEEPPHRDDQLPPLVYDEESDMSYVACSTGKRLPFVEAGAAGWSQTQTQTKIRAEATDSDPADDCRVWATLDTQTSTAVRAETTDTDLGDEAPRAVACLGTDTLTFVQAEATDTDPEDDRPHLPPD